MTLFLTKGFNKCAEVFIQPKTTLESVQKRVLSIFSLSDSLPFYIVLTRQKQRKVQVLELGIGYPPKISNRVPAANTRFYPRVFTILNIERMCNYLRAVGCPLLFYYSTKIPT